MTDAQLTACASLEEGVPCDAAGTPGICDREVCVAGCGDGSEGNDERDDSIEECDDGNFTSHDGCSSRCKLEVPVWVELEKPNLARMQHVAGYHKATNQLVVLGGFDTEGVLADQWTRSADGKWSVVLTTPIGKRQGAAMAYDDARAKLMLFGGTDGDGTVHNDLWEYDGATWREVIVANRPPARQLHRMVYDTVRGQLIMFGGSRGTDFLGDTWTFDLATQVWTEFQGTGPGSRIRFDMVWDGTRVVLFGGESINYLIRGDTWAFDPAAETWTLAVAPTAAAPRNRYGFAMAQAENGTIVLFGGLIDGFVAANDVWELGASGWSKRTTTIAPTARIYATLTLDPAAEAPDPALVLIGGLGTGGPEALEDVWHLGSDWSERSSGYGFKPAGRYAQLVYDDEQQQVLMFGGFGAGDDTWTFGNEGDTTRWTLRSDPNVAAICPAPAGQPLSRHFYSMAYDRERKRALIFGGLDECFTLPRDTYEWNRDTATWTVATADGPTGRISAAIAYDAAAKVTVLFGGRDYSQVLADTWEYDGTWTLQPDAGGPGPTEQAAMTFDPVRGHVVMIDEVGRTWGYIDHTWLDLELTTEVDPPRTGAALAYDAKLGVVLFGGGTRTELTRYGDLWRLSSQAEGWEPVASVGLSPAPRSAPMVADPCRNELVLFGGLPVNGTGFFDDTWQFRYRSLTPDEICTNGIDDDDDRQLDELDPDCDARCVR